MDDGIKERELGMFFLLMVVTLGLYALYVVPKLAPAMNRLIGKDEFRYHHVLWVGIFTFGLGIAVFEVLYAYALQNNPEYTKGVWSLRNLGGYVLVFNFVGVALCMYGTSLSIGIGFLFGIWATWLLQDQVNRYLDTHAAVAGGHA